MMLAAEVTHPLMHAVTLNWFVKGLFVTIVATLAIALSTANTEPTMTLKHSAHKLHQVTLQFLRHKSKSTKPRAIRPMPANRSHHLQQFPKAAMVQPATMNACPSIKSPHAQTPWHIFLWTKNSQIPSKIRAASVRYPAAPSAAYKTYATPVIWATQSPINAIEIAAPNKIAINSRAIKQPQAWPLPFVFEQAFTEKPEGAEGLHVGGILAPVAAAVTAYEPVADRSSWPAMPLPPFSHGPSATPSVVFGPAVVFVKTVPDGVVTAHATVDGGVTVVLRATAATLPGPTQPLTVATGAVIVGQPAQSRVTVIDIIESGQFADLSFTVVSPVVIVPGGYVCWVCGCAPLDCDVPSWNDHSKSKVAFDGFENWAENVHVHGSVGVGAPFTEVTVGQQGGILTGFVSDAGKHVELIVPLGNSASTDTLPLIGSKNWIDPTVPDVWFVQSALVLVFGSVVINLYCVGGVWPSSKVQTYWSGRSDEQPGGFHDSVALKFAIAGVPEAPPAHPW
jgi:hypothetical protein